MRQKVKLIYGVIKVNKRNYSCGSLLSNIYILDSYLGTVCEFGKTGTV